jgi:hypothetical protein
MNGSGCSSEVIFVRDFPVVVLNSKHLKIGNCAPKRGHTVALALQFRPAPLLVKYVEAGWLGWKTGRGFYDYAGPELVPRRCAPTALMKVHTSIGKGGF